MIRRGRGEGGQAVLTVCLDDGQRGGKARGGCSSNDDAEEAHDEWACGVFTACQMTLAAAIQVRRGLGRLTVGCCWTVRIGYIYEKERGLQIEAKVSDALRYSNMRPSPIVCGETCNRESINQEGSSWPV